MNTKALVGVLVVIAIILLGFGFYKSYQANRQTVENPAAGIQPAETEEYAIDRINVKHQYKAGRHILVGEIDLPTSCHVLNQSVTKSADNKKATISFTATSTAEFCAQVITVRRFKVEITGPQDLAIDATFNGKPLILNVFEATANEDLDAFEIEIKG